MEIQDAQYIHLTLACIILWVFIVDVLFSVYSSRGSVEALGAKKDLCIDRNTV